MHIILQIFSIPSYQIIDSEEEEEEGEEWEGKAEEDE